MRELGAVLGKLQLLEQTLCNRKHIATVLLGDTNKNENDPNLVDRSSFTDSWEAISTNKDRPGWTFDPVGNLRADKSQSYLPSPVKTPRRIDRIYISTGSAWCPIESRLLGTHGGPLQRHPSDHYGVEITFRLKKDPDLLTHARLLYDGALSGRNTWAQNAIPSSESLLALILDDEAAHHDGLDDDGHLNLYSPTSSLPLPHITLLMGFCDLFSDELRSLASQAVKDCVQQALHQDDSAKQSFSLPFCEESLSVFEHTGSATLVALPCASKNDKQCNWLYQLYETLRACFPRCHDQESRFKGGWQPHLSLQSFTTTDAARYRIKQMLSSGIWTKRKIPVRSIGIFRRSPHDGEFYAVESIPLVRHPLRVSDAMTSFIRDAGKHSFSYMQGVSSLVQWEVHRAISFVTKNDDRYKNVQPRLVTVGSFALCAGLPGISDLDAVVTIQPRGDEPLPTGFCAASFLVEVKRRLQSLHLRIKARRRSAVIPGERPNLPNHRLEVLTLRLWPQSPSFDISVCICDASGRPVDSPVTNKTTYESIRNSPFLRDRIIAAASTQTTTPTDFTPIFYGALRIVKLWAVRRSIYGNSMGYVGGGGWAIWLARIVIDCLRDGTLAILEHDNIDDQSQASASRRIVAHFWRRISRTWDPSMVVSIANCVSSEHRERPNHSRMSILDSSGCGNFWKSSTRSTIHATKVEFERAAALLDSILPEDECFKGILSPIQAEEIIRGPALVLTVKASKDAAPGGDSIDLPAETETWGKTRLLSSLVALEQKLSEEQCRPLCVSKSSSKFLVAIQPRGNQQHCKISLSEFVRKRNIDFSAEFIHESHLEWVEEDEARALFNQKHRTK